MSNQLQLPNVTGNFRNDIISDFKTCETDFNFVGAQAPSFAFFLRTIQRRVLVEIFTIFPQTFVMIRMPDFWGEKIAVTLGCDLPLPSY